MIEFFRKTAGGFAGKIILGLIVAAFVVIAVIDYFRDPGVNGPVAEIGGEEYSQDAFVRDLRTRLARVRAGEVAQPQNFSDLAFIDELVSRRALFAEARALGIVAPDAVVASAGRSKAYFRDQAGAFSSDNYQQFLNFARVSADTFDDAIRRDETIRILERAIAASLPAPRATTELAWRWRREERDVSYLSLTPESVSAPEAPDAAVLRAYYDENLDRFRQPRLRRASVLVILAADLADPSAVTDEEIRRVYNNRISTFVRPEARDLQVLFFDSMEAAEEAKARIADGARIVEIVAEIGATLEETEIGYVSQSSLASLNPALAEAVFAPEATAQSIVGPVALPNGQSALVAVNGILPGVETSFEEARGALAMEIATRRAAASLDETKSTVEDLIAQGVPLATIAEDSGYRMIETVIDADGLDADGVPADLPFADDDFPARVFAGRLNFAEARAYTLEDEAGYYAIEAIEDIPERTPPFEEVETRVLASWTARERRRIMIERAETIRERLEAGEDIAALAEEYGLETARSYGLTRYRSVSDTQAPLNEAVFALSSQSATGAVVLIESAGGEAREVARIDAVREPSADSYAIVADDARAEIDAELMAYFTRDVQIAHVTDFSIDAVAAALQREEQQR